MLYTILHLWNRSAMRFLNKCPILGFDVPRICGSEVLYSVFRYGYSPFFVVSPAPKTLTSSSPEFLLLGCVTVTVGGVFAPLIGGVNKSVFGTIYHVTSRPCEFSGSRLKTHLFSRFFPDFLFSACEATCVVIGLFSRFSYLLLRDCCRAHSVSERSVFQLLPARWQMCVGTSCALVCVSSHTFFLLLLCWENGDIRLSWSISRRISM